MATRGEYNKPVVVPEGDQFQLGNDVFKWEKKDDKVIILHLRWDPQFVFDANESEKIYKKRK